MRCKAIETIERYEMLRQGEVLLGLSGGADSMSLLYLLHGLQKEFGFRLKAAHVHHGLRGSEADRDEAFVRAACEKLSVPLDVLHADVAAEAAASGEGLEACGRRIRYAYFRSLAQGEIATAHTADDNAETVLLHLTRGSGLSGLCGIPPVRDGVIRPLIDCTRADVERFCAENGIAYITDSSNLSDDYARNRIRHHVIPVLRELNPAFSEAVLRCGSVMRQDDFTLAQCADELLRTSKTQFGFSRSMLLNAPQAIQDRAIRKILTVQMNHVPEYRQILQSRAVLQDCGKAQLEAKTTICAYGDAFYFDRPASPGWVVCVDDKTVDLPFGRAELQIEFSENTQNVYKQDLTNCFCCDTIYSALFFRNRRPGDAMTRANSDCRKSFKKLMEEQGVPAPFRADVPILTDGRQIIWIEGIGCDKQFQITEKSKCIMRIRIIREDDDESGH